MTTISGAASSTGRDWAALQAARQAQRSRMQDAMFARTDADGSGTVDGTELQGLLQGAAKARGTTATATATAEDLVGKFGTNGTLDKDQLAKAMESLMPQRSTVDFAQARSTAAAGGGTGATAARGSAGDDLFGKVDSDADGSLSATEFQALQDRMSGKTGASASSASSTSGTDAGEQFARLDTDDDGTLSAAEFDAGRPSGAGGQTAGAQGAAGGTPPPPGGPGGPGGAGGASASASTTYDPQDTNEDGTVSAAERMAATATDATTTGATASATGTASTTGTGTSTDPLQALFKAVDGDGDGRIGREEAEVLSQKITDALTALSTGGTTTADGSDSDDGRRGFDLSQLVLKQYQQVGAAGSTTVGSTGSTLSAVA
ncbi:EF-hand domain-containing protein [Xylophilus ampelinus]|uniref:EF hand domain-containing protein n=1 Tax=Xylophilus ampelinus TaxID=54067 RepID=A0A318SE58_9BURK|nr:EF-hand domain-containing protein [Xylophilus ampelinus]MCS4511483.1 EF-hand domain-containing protein [Xylophilus ampelinus]PYE74819.1 EF hand domain-containing protein [Xylophilus ampelinus]